MAAATVAKLFHHICGHDCDRCALRCRHLYCRLSFVKCIVKQGCHCELPSRCALAQQPDPCLVMTADPHSQIQQLLVMQLLCKTQSNLSIGCVHYNFDQAESVEGNVHLSIALCHSAQQPSEASA